MSTSMLLYVRSTIVFDDNLFREAKKAAAAGGTTLSDLVNRALRDALSRQPPKPAARFAVLAFGEPTGAEHHEPEDFAAALEDEDVRAFGR